MDRQKDKDIEINYLCIDAQIIDRWRVTKNKRRFYS